MKKEIEFTEILQRQHMKTIWCFFACLFLGFWLLTAHAVFGYKSAEMIYSDMVSGILVIFFSLCALSCKKTWAPWLLCLVGLWLEFAPLIFWAPDALSYASDTLIGALLIIFSLLVPGVPGKLHSSGPEIPPGWSYNPSSWMQRIPIIFFGCVGWFIARALTAYQLGYIDHIWDPFFGQGTVAVITSKISKAFPVPDAGLGALAYTIEALMGCKGDSRRWCTMPWIVVGFGILVVPLGLISIILVILQPLVVGAWCSLCLCTATAMLIMISLTIDEMVAVLQFLGRVKKKKLPFWKIFWGGSEDPLASPDIRTPLFKGSIFKMGSSMTWGVTVPWNLALSALLGAALMMLPSLLGVGGSLADADHILGALIVTISVISMAEVVRTGRYINVLFSGILILFTVISKEKTLFVLLSHLSYAILLILLSLPRGKILEKYGKWSSYIR